MVRVNTKGVPLAGELLPDGVYKMQLTSAKPGKTKSGGEPKDTVAFTIRGGALDGRQVFRTITYGEKALPFTKTFFVRMGIDPDIMEGEWDSTELLKELIESADIVTGRITTTVADSGPYKGQASNNLTIIDEDAWGEAGAEGEDSNAVFEVTELEPIGGKHK